MSSTNHIKIGSSTKLSLSKGNITVGVKGTTEYGPTSESGFYNGITPPVGGYTIYVEKVSQGPSIHVPANNTECMYYLKKYGAPDGTIDDMLTWALTQNTILVLKGELTNSIQTASFQNVAGSNDATGFFFGGFRNDGLLDFVKVGFLANGTGVTNAPVTAIDRNNQTITISGSQFVSGQFYTFSLNTDAEPSYYTYSWDIDTLSGGSDCSLYPNNPTTYYSSDASITLNSTIMYSDSALTTPIIGSYNDGVNVYYCWNRPPMGGAPSGTVTQITSC